jgi:hypothetical protein
LLPLLPPPLLLPVVQLVLRAFRTTAVAAPQLL